MTDAELVKAKPQLCAAMIHGNLRLVDEFLENRTFNHKQCDELKAYVDTARAIAGMALDQQAAQRLLEANGQKPPAQTLRSSAGLLMPDGASLAPFREKTLQMDEHAFNRLISSVEFHTAVVLDDAHRLIQLLDGLVFSEEQTEWLRRIQHREYARHATKVIGVLRRVNAHQPFPGDQVMQVLRASTPATPLTAQTPTAPINLTPLLESLITSAVIRDDRDELRNLLADRSFTADELDTLRLIGSTYTSPDTTAADQLVETAKQLALRND